MTSPVLEVRELRHAYGERIALDGISFEVAEGEIFTLLGPNGGGKTTLFRILTTLMAPGGGDARIFGHSILSGTAPIRKKIGVVFQEPSLDPKLTALENMIHHGHFYGMRGRPLRSEAMALLDTFGLKDRAGDLTETLSGGLRRRVELAKALLPGPALLFADEPSTGLDPGARLEFAAELQRLRAERGTTVVLTTHFMEEADRSDRVGILHEGNLVALGEPEKLKESVGGDVVVIQTPDPESLSGKLKERFGHEAQAVDGSVRIEIPRAHEFSPRVVETFPGEVKSLSFGRPTLEDVFIQKTGRKFWDAQEEEASREDRK
ncbi:MAG: ABC transporter ATP-binding protein [Nitrospinota bacterium]